MNSKAVERHASALKGFLMTSWIKGDEWKRMKDDIISLTSSMDGLCCKSSKQTKQDREFKYAYIDCWGFSAC